MSQLRTIERWKQKLRHLKIEIYALYLAYRDPRVPWYAKAFVALVVGYAFSPIDLIPDFIPVLGYLDDLVLIPLGVAVAIKMIPEKVMDDCRIRAKEMMGKKKPINRIAAVVIICNWLILLVVTIALVVRAASTK
ncbi:MAG: DUF1232 domain-containing protein [Desulfobacterales bacterium]|nr:DUF1232 domain-containing protein [Desulfobacterales bacterium]